MARRVKKKPKQHVEPRGSRVKAFLLIVLLALMMAAVLAKKLRLWR